jgi:hypothetical protein
LLLQIHGTNTNKNQHVTQENRTQHNRAESSKVNIYDGSFGQDSEICKRRLKGSGREISYCIGAKSIGGIE